jgi:flavorubredoxin
VQISNEEKNMAKALVVFATRSGATKQIAEYIAEGMRMAGHDTDVVNANDIKKEADLKGYDAVVFGSATYHGDMLPGMKTLLFLAEKAGLTGKAGGSFGAFGWSGEAPDRIYDTMKNIFQMHLAGGPLRLKSGSVAGGIQVAQAYGREIAEKIK